MGKRKMKAKTTRRKKALWLVSLLPCLIGLLSAAQPAFADFSAKVMEIVGGDTIILWHNNRTEKIRLNGVVCPDKTQPYGGQAKRFTSFMVQNKDVTVPGSIGGCRQGRAARVVGRPSSGSALGMEEAAAPLTPPLFGAVARPEGWTSLKTHQMSARFR